MALEHIYQHYRAHTAFFIIYMAERDPSGYWLHVSDAGGLHARAQEAHNCPSSKGLTIPRLLDDAQGSGDYLYRADPFRLCIVDIDGNISYCSRDEQDGERTDLDKVIQNTLEPLNANGGRAPARLLAQQRCDAAGKIAAGFWLPRVEYFTAAPMASASAGGANTAEINDAQGKVTRVTAAQRDEFLRKRTQVIRLFTRGAAPSTRPVTLIFGNEKTLPAATLQAVEQFYRKQRKTEDCYLIYTGSSANLAASAQQAARWARSHQLTIPCLLDTPEHEVSFAYAAAAPRVCVLRRDAKNHWVMRYASQPGAAGVLRGLAESARILRAAK